MLLCEGIEFRGHNFLRQEIPEITFFILPFLELVLKVFQNILSQVRFYVVQVLLSLLALVVTTLLLKFL